MNKQHLLPFLMALLIFHHQALAADLPLEGRVHQNGVRICRPQLQPAAPETAPQPLTGVVNDNTFQLKDSTALTPATATEAPVNAPALSGRIDQSTIEGQNSAPLLQPALEARNSHPLSAARNARIPLQTAASAAPAGTGHEQPPLVDDYNARKTLSGSLTFRFCYYDLGDGTECTWEGLRDAIYLLGKGADIALMLDRGGVRLANRHNGHEYQLHRGSTEKQVKTQQMLREFIDKGGKVFASERWARHFGLWGGSYPALTGGVTLLSDEEMAEMLVERSGRIVEY